MGDHGRVESTTTVSIWANPVMQRGEVESGSFEEIFTKPRSPYRQMLLAAAG